MATHKRPRRGELHWVNLDPAIGSETRKRRPAVILSNDAQNTVGQRVLAAPVTSNVSRLYSFEAALTVDGRSCKAMLDQVRCLDQSRLAGFLGRVTPAELKDLERALRVAFDLE